MLSNLINTVNRVFSPSGITHADVLPIVRNGVKTTGALLGNTKLSVQGCRVVADGIAPAFLGQAPEDQMIWFYENDANWIFIHAPSKTVLTKGSAVALKTGEGYKLTLGQMTATLTWR